MTKNEFIFSPKISHRITRHVLFWLMFAVHIFFFRFYVYNLKYLSYGTTYLIRLEDLLLFLPVSFFYAYFAIYYLLPFCILKGRYARLFIIVLFLSILLALFSYLLTTLFNVRLAWDMPVHRASIIRQVDFTFNNGLVYPLAVSGFAIGIKMSKNFYLQQKRNELLSKQKLHAEMQLMKGQVHPRFLLHSLNSIYSDMLDGAKQSPEMLLKLSDLLSYILYESDKMMPLEKELLLLKNYVALEKISWGDRMVVDIQDNIKTEGKFIEPLLLLPIAEYIFMNVDIKSQEQNLLSIILQMKEDVFFCSISAKSKTITDPFKENSHLLQLEKRLQSQYGGRHQFKVIIDKDSIAILLSLNLNE